MNLPKSWSREVLGELGDWYGGGTPSKQDPRLWEGGTIPWVSPKDMKVFEIHDSEDHITEQAISSSAARRVPSGSVLFVTRSGILERTLPVAVTAVEVTMNQDLKALTPGRGIEPKCVAYAARANKQEILRACSKDGTTVASIETDRLKRFSIPIPPAPEQPRIVEALESYLTRIDDAVATLERVRRNLKRYRASVLRAAVEGRLVPTEADLARAEGRDYEPASKLLERILTRRRQAWEHSGRKGKYTEPATPDRSGLPELPEGWYWATVDQLSLDVRYGTSARTTEDAVAAVPVLRMGNIVDGEIDWTSLKYLPENHSEFPELLLKQGDLLFNRTNSAELVGKTAVYAGGRAPLSFASYLIRLRMLPGARSEMLSYFINSSAGRAWIASVAVQQVGQANVNGSKLKALAVPLAPEREQTRIIERVESLVSISRGAERESEGGLRRLARLRQSILKWAFEGKLVDQDPCDEPASVLLQRIKAERAAAAPAANSRAKKSRTRVAR